MRPEDQLAGVLEELGRLRIELADARAMGARAEALLDHIPFMAWMKRADGVFLAVNEAFALAAGRPRERILGRTDHGLWPAEDTAAYLADDARVIASGRKVSVEERIAGTSGTTWFETFKAPVFDADGRVVGTVGLARDITERKRAEEQQRVLEARIQQAEKLESLGLLAGGVAHDFNNLLVGVLSNAELALRYLQHVPDAQRAIERIQDIRLAAMRAAELTHQMLAYSGRGSLIVRPASLNELVGDVLQLLGASISEKAQVRCDLAPALPLIEGDVTQLRQVIMNLITNASDALGHGEGTIRVATGVETLATTGHVDAAGNPALAPGRYVYLEVSDDGSGMSEETRARLFEPFYSTKRTGRGLGLSVVHGIVRGHRGGLLVDSVLGRGTTIRALFPVSERAAEPRARAQETVSREWQGSGLILLVDDDDRVRSSATLALEELGFEVQAAASGREALEHFEQNAARVRLVMLDMSMPDLGGAQVFAQLRAIRSDVRVLLCSGYDEHDARERMEHDALVGFLPKPYSFETLRRSLRELLES